MLVDVVLLQAELGIELGHLDGEGKRNGLEERCEMIAGGLEYALAGRTPRREIAAVAHPHRDMHERVLGISVRDAVRGGRVRPGPQSTDWKNACSERRLMECVNELRHIEPATEIIGVLDDDVRHGRPRGKYLTSQISHRPGIEARREDSVLRLDRTRGPEDAALPAGRRGDERSNMSANGKVAVVTGGGSGIGRAASLALLADGWRVALVGRHRASLDRTIEQAGAHRRNALAVVADVSDPDSVRALFARTEEAFGRVDMLFNNAGVSSPASALEEVSFVEWSRVIATNLTGAFLCTQEAFRIMKRQRPRGGRIINNGSISAHTPRPNSVAYTASKHAIAGLTKSTALEGRELDIACGQLDIGNARTELADGLIAAARASGRSPEPMMDVQHVADAVLRMANLPLDANVLFMTLMATKMPYVGRG